MYPPAAPQYVPLSPSAGSLSPQRPPPPATHSCHSPWHLQPPSASIPRSNINAPPFTALVAASTKTSRRLFTCPGYCSPRTFSLALLSADDDPSPRAPSHHGCFPHAGRLSQLSPSVVTSHRPGRAARFVAPVLFRLPPRARAPRLSSPSPRPRPIMKPSVPALAVLSAAGAARAQGSSFSIASDSTYASGPPDRSRERRG